MVVRRPFIFFLSFIIFSLLLSLYSQRLVVGLVVVPLCVAIVAVCLMEKEVLGVRTNSRETTTVEERGPKEKRGEGEVEEMGPNIT